MSRMFPQDVLHKLYRCIRNYRKEKGKFRSYLGTVVHNEISDFLKKLDKRKDIGRGGNSDGALSNCADPASLESQLMDAFDSDLAQAVLLRLPDRVNPRDLKIFQRFVDGARAKEVAAEFNLTVKTVLNVKSQVKKICEQELERLKSEGPGGASP
jgi:RNA polymerase sigma factor (sigma-70 family)